MSMMTGFFLGVAVLVTVSLCITYYAINSERHARANAKGAFKTREHIKHQRVAKAR